MPQDADAAPGGKLKPWPKKQPDAVSWFPFTTPQPIRRLFDKFPFHIYPHNELPQRTAQRRDQNTLYIFITEDGAGRGLPSFNPGCLKWQTYLKFSNVSFITVSSNNHASPSGALPFLLPAVPSSTPPEASSPVASNRIQRWTRDTMAKRKGNSKELALDNEETEQPGTRAELRPSTREGTYIDASEMRHEAYMSLLDHRIRNAYLYSLYLSSPNFDSVAFPLYVAPCTTNTLLRLALSRQLRAAAEGELLKQYSRIDVESIYQESDRAFGALSELLGEKDYFFGGEMPELFDASVFAYTNVLLDEGLDWRDARMANGLRKFTNLIDHRERIFEEYFQ